MPNPKNQSFCVGSINGNAIVATAISKPAAIPCDPDLEGFEYSIVPMSQADEKTRLASLDWTVDARETKGNESLVEFAVHCSKMTLGLLSGGHELAFAVDESGRVIGKTVEESSFVPGCEILSVTTDSEHSILG